LPERVLVTGVLGCLGAWVARAILDDGDEPIGFDPGGDRSRLELVLGRDADRVTVVPGDVTDGEQVAQALDELAVTRVVHLAGLQVPFCRADPVAGTRVNVLGTVNVFEAVKERLDRIPGLAYASSAAVYSLADPSPAPEGGGLAPSTLYGVTKQANEGTARVYWDENEVRSIGIRPYCVYGPARDQGVTSGPSLAMAAAARGEGFHIGFGGSVQYDFAPDVGRAFAAAARRLPDRAAVANFPGVSATTDEVVTAIEAAAPEAAGLVTWEDVLLPFPAALEASALDGVLGEGTVPRTTLADGVAATVDHYRRDAYGGQALESE
jgi:UDP-glucuronate 4-epimerase